ncbi:MAG: hypothetical protein ACFFER_19650 [Candidatus Thorarchaeota archaeon]
MTRAISVYEYLDRLENIVGPRSSVLPINRGPPRAEVLICAIDDLSDSDDQDAFEYLKRILTSQWAFDLKWPSHKNFRWTWRFDRRQVGHSQMEITNEIHGRCLAALEGMGNPAVHVLALNYLNGLRWDATVEEGCKSRAYLQWSSLDTARIAERIVLKNDPEPMIPIYRRFLETLLWDDTAYHSNTIGEWAANGIASVLRGDAVDELMLYFFWHHAKFQCVFEDYIDSRILDAIVSIGEEAIPHLLPYINAYGEEILKILGFIGGRSTDLLAEYFSEGFEWEYKKSARAVVKYLFKENHSSALDIALIVLMSCMSVVGSNQEDCVEGFNLREREDSIIERLENKNMKVRNGAAYYFSIVPSGNSIDSLIDLCANCFRKGWYEKPEWADPDDAEEWLLYFAAEAAQKNGAEAIEIVMSKLLDEDWAYRATAILLLTTIGIREGGRDLLSTLELIHFLERFYDLSPERDGNYTKMNYLFHRYDIPYTDTRIKRTIALAEHLIPAGLQGKWDKKLYDDILDETLERDSSLFQKRIWEEPR